MEIQRTLQTKRKFDFSSLTIIFLTIALTVVLTVLSNEIGQGTFMTFNNIHSILYGVSINFFAAIGFTYLLIMGELDLSIGSMFAFGGMFMGWLMLQDVPLALAMIISLLCCMGFGFLNGFMVVKFKVSSMMITLGSMTAVRGLADLLCSNMYGREYSLAYQGMAKVKLGEGEHAVYLTILIMVILVVVLEIMLHRTSIFKKMYYVGENIETAKIYGIKSAQIKVAVFIISALLAGFGGILQGARIGYADTNIGSGLEFTTLTAVVLGGASLSGGKGSILRTCVAMIFIAMIQSAIIMFNINPHLQQLIIGVILIIAVFVDTRVALAGSREDRRQEKLAEVEEGVAK